MACTGGFVRTGWMAAQAGTERLRGRGGLLYAGVARGAPRPCWAYSATRGRPRSLVCTLLGMPGPLGESALLGYVVLAMVVRPARSCAPWPW